MRVLLAAVVCALALAGCGDDRSAGSPTDRQLDPTPTKLDGTESGEFEDDDIARAEGASQALQDYCEGAVSEAQQLGCLSHADEP